MCKNPPPPTIMHVRLDKLPAGVVHYTKTETLPPLVCLQLHCFVTMQEPFVGRGQPLRGFSTSWLLLQVLLQDYLIVYSLTSSLHKLAGHWAPCIKSSAAADSWFCCGCLLYRIT
jgi:hypothetical protein